MLFSTRQRLRLALVSIFASTSIISCGGGGGDSGPSAPPPANWLIPVDQVVDGGPGPDGIPSIDLPIYENIQANTLSDPNGLVIAVKIDGDIRAYPHDVMNWHEIVNDRTSASSMVLSYCPLTGTAFAWEGDETGTGRLTYGVSGLLYNSNLILYDRQTGSRWSQMLELAVEGQRIREVPGRFQVVETTLASLEAMYPGTKLMTRDTSYSRDYDESPYPNYTLNDSLLFPVSHEDNRLHRKERVVGIRSEAGSRVYQIAGFGPTTQTINEDFQGMPIVVTGNSSLNFGVIYERTLDDGTILSFTPDNSGLPNVMQDSEGNVWDVFGLAVSGPRAGTQLKMTRSYTSMWFAWATFFQNAEIYFN